MRTGRMTDLGIRNGGVLVHTALLAQATCRRNEFLPEDCHSDEINFHDRRNEIAPKTISPAATKRDRPTFSFSTRKEMSTPKRIAVSRSAATTAIGAMVIAQSARPYDPNVPTPPIIAGRQ